MGEVIKESVSQVTIGCHDESLDVLYLSTGIYDHKVMCNLILKVKGFLLFTVKESVSQVITGSHDESLEHWETIIIATPKL